MSPHPTTTRTLPLAVSALMALAGCVTGSRASGPSIEYEDDLSILDVETDPGWLGALYEEAEGLAPQPATAVDGAWRAQVLASSAPKFNPKYPQVVIVPLGAETSPAVCHLLQTGAPVATVMRALATPVLQRGNRFEVKYLAVHARQTPVIVVHGLSSGGPVSSDHIVITYVKVVAAIGPRGAVVCEHHRFGQRETVERVAASLAQSLTWTESARVLGVVEVIEGKAGPAAVRTSVRTSSTSASVFHTQIERRGRGAVGAIDHAETYTLKDGGRQLGACVRRRDGEADKAEGAAGRALGCGSDLSQAAAQAVLTP